MNQRPTSTDELNVVPLRRGDFLRLLLRRDKITAGDTGNGRDSRNTDRAGWGAFEKAVNRIIALRTGGLLVLDDRPLTMGVFAFLASALLVWFLGGQPLYSSLLACTLKAATE